MAIKENSRNIGASVILVAVTWTISRTLTAQAMFVTGGLPPLQWIN
jgi:hypothetical protein